VGKVKLSPDFTDFAWVTAKEAENYGLISGVLQELQAFSSKNFKNST
jgi:ATP-dependent protease ClpP protease subunit